jgi:hypothetical protein
VKVVHILVERKMDDYSRKRIGDSYYINPQNAQEQDGCFSKELDLESEVKPKGMQRIGGVLVPVEIAKAKPCIRAPTICHLCRKYGSVRSVIISEGITHFTRCEVSQHNIIEDCWIISRGFVYNSTAFLRDEDHPGGERAFMRRAGGCADCAEDYDFHSARGRKLWAKYRIGVLIDCDDFGKGELVGGCIIS